MTVKIVRMVDPAYLRWNERHDKYPSRTVNTPHKSKYNQNELATARQHEDARQQLSVLGRHAPHPSRDLTTGNGAGARVLSRTSLLRAGEERSAHSRRSAGTRAGAPPRRLVAEGKGFCSNFTPLVGWCERLVCGQRSIDNARAGCAFLTRCMQSCTAVPCRLAACCQGCTWWGHLCTATS